MQRMEGMTESETCQTNRHDFEFRGERTREQSSEITKGGKKKMH